MDLKTIYDLYNNLKTFYKNKDLMVFKKDDKWNQLSIEDAIGVVNKLALALNHLGFKKGDKIALLSNTRYEWSLWDLAIEIMGMVNVPIYYTLTMDQVKYIIKHSESKALIVSDKEKLKEVLQYKDEFDITKYILIDEDPNPLDNDVVTMNELQELGNDIVKKNGTDFIDYIGKSIDETDLASIVYTSGTTGTPKGVMLSHKNFISNSYGACERVDLDICDRSLLFLPLSHSYGRTTTYALLMSGVTLWYAENIEKLAQNMIEAKPNFITVVPRLLEKIYEKVEDKASSKGIIAKKIFKMAENTAKRYTLKKQENQRISLFTKIKHKLSDILVYKKIREKMGGEIKYIVSGSSSLTNKISYLFNSAKLPVIEGYGLTEASPMVSGNSLKKNKIGSIGYPYYNVEVKLSEDNELLVRGPNVMIGYYKNELETEETITEDGWLKTGDICNIDKDNYIYIVDRVKDLIKTSNGKYIAPQKIEHIAKQHSLISEVVIVGEKKKFVSALILPNFGKIMEKAQEINIDFKTIEELIKDSTMMKSFEIIVDDINQKLEDFEKIKKFILLSNPFTIEGGELTPTLKVIKKYLLKKYENQISRMYQ